MDLQIPEFLASSSPLTVAERANINQLLDTSNNEISRLSAAIDKLVLEKERLQANVASYKAILAPIRLLPEDMLREIFVSCLPSEEAASTAITDAPLLLGRVCRSWREIALSTPELWTSIHIQFLFETDTLRLCDEAHAWIARSGTCPLTIRVTWNTVTDDPVPGNFIDSLTIFSKRWRSIEIQAPPQWMASLRSLSKSDVPRLERFNYSATPGAYNDGQVSETLWQSLDILEGERLHDVTLNNTWVQNPIAATSKINFEQLARLDLSFGFRFTSQHAADILTRCPNLIACHLLMASSYPTEPTARFAPITLLHLSSLTIELCQTYPDATPSDNEILGHFFSNLTLPQLNSFSHNLGQYHICPWTGLARASPIENLDLSLSDFGDPAVLEYLRTSTSLKRLKFSAWPSFAQEYAPGVDPLAPLMAIDNASDVVCPFLEVLELPSFGFSEEVFVELVRQRAALRDSEGKAHLKVVRADFHCNVQLDILSQLDDLMASGLSLSVSYRPLIRPEDMIHYWPCQLPDLGWPHKIGRFFG
ncbi:hypothetical protein C8J56DRAFT_833435 [Mycena floridula]|nr:hypothetical protein C8J56DRAFT_833435 [Mycena floridula]